MYDMHYDLLTILYYTFNIRKDSNYLEKLIVDLGKIYNKKNVIGGIVNLYFMTLQEMQEEFGFTEKELNDVCKMFKISVNLLENMKLFGFIDKDTDLLYSIEGASYINLEDLDELYDLGVRSIIPVYNYRNRYGSGFREVGGLTSDGVKLIERMIELGMIVDVSHANEETFFDMIKVAENKKKQGASPIVMASHSNVRELCSRPRNLTDAQILKLKEVDGYLSLFTNSNFVCANNMSMSYEERQQEFLKHIDYLINKLDFPVNRILMSSDDMNFHPDPSYHHFETFPLETMASDMRKLLTEAYDEDFASRVLVDNASELFEKVKQKKCSKHI